MSHQVSRVRSSLNTPWIRCPRLYRGAAGPGDRSRGLVPHRVAVMSSAAVWLLRRLCWFPDLGDVRLGQLGRSSTGSAPRIAGPAALAAPSDRRVFRSSRSAVLGRWPGRSWCGEPRSMAWGASRQRVWILFVSYTQAVGRPGGLGFGPSRLASRCDSAGPVRDFKRGGAYNCRWKHRRRGGLR